MARSMERRRALAATVAVSINAALGSPVRAQAWPERTVRMVVPAGPGAAPDIVARILAERLSSALGKGVIVDNRPGAGGIPGMSALARSAPDGYTVGFVPAAMALVTPLVFRNPQFNPDTDFSPVATVAISPLLIAVPASLGIGSVAEFVRHVKAQPGKLNFAAPQLNSLPHLAGELFARTAGIELLTVPYTSQPAAVAALLAGEAAMVVDGIPGLLPHLRSGRLRGLAVTAGQRVQGLDLPAVAETYPGFEVVGWFQILVPAGTPAAIAERINTEVNRALQAPEVAARLADFGVFPRTDSIAASREFFAAQQRVMKKLVGDLGVQPQ